MDKQGMYSNLNFKLPPRRIPPQIMAALIVMALFTFVWLVIPHAFLYWVLLIPLASLAWAATYGFRNALADLIKVLRKLENL